MNPELPLRDIHLPAPIGWWPPAPGWWIAAVVVLTVITFVIWWYRKHQRDVAVYRFAQHELEQIRQRHQQSQDTAQLGQELSVLLRRVAMSITPRKQSAGLAGEDWLAYLDHIVDRPLFCSDTGRLLLTLPYQPTHTEGATRLLSLVEEWLSLAGKNRRGAHA